METNIIEVNETVRELSVKLSASELQPHYDKAYEAALPHIEMKGYRKGKVPLAIVKKFHGKKIEADALEEIAAQTFSDVAKEQELEVLGNIDLKDIRRENDGSVELIFRYEVFPVFELIDYRTLNLKKLDPVVEDTAVEDAITNILYEAATLEDEDLIEGKNVLLEITVTPVDEATGVPLVGARSHNAKLNFRDPRVNPEIIEKSQGLRVGDSFRMKVQNTETKNMEEVLFSINEISKLIPAELNDAFVEQLTQAQLSTVDELREQVRIQLTQDKEAFAQRQLSQDIVNTLVIEHKFNVSERYMRVVLDRMLQEFASQYPEGKVPQSVNIQQVAQEMLPEVFVRARWDVISHRIADREGIRLEDEDLRSEAEILARQYNIDVEMAMQYIKGAPAATLTLAQEKVLDFIKDNNNIDDVDDAGYMAYQEEKMKWLQEKSQLQQAAAEKEAGQSSSLIVDPSEQPKTSGNIIV